MPAELEWIVRKAMAKDRAGRYATAGDLAGDIERFLLREPVAAGPSTRRYRLESYPADHWLVRYTAAALGRALARLGRFGEAEPLMMEARALEPPPGLGERRLQVARWTADLYGDWGKPELEAEWRRRVQDIESSVRESVR